MIASTDNSLPALAKVPDWTPPPDAAMISASPARAAGLDRKHPAPGHDGLGQTGTDWPTRFARMVTEALAGGRPAGQILPWTSKRARSQFLRLLRAFGSTGPGSTAGRPGGTRGGQARGGSQPRIVRVVATRPARDTIEMSVIARFGERVRALALRLERITGEDRQGEWICTDIEAA